MDRVFHIKSSTGKYNYVQEARCKHCAGYGLKRCSDPIARGVSYCYIRSKLVNRDSYACDVFKPNSKYVIANTLVQLNIFDYA